MFYLLLILIRLSLLVGNKTRLVLFIAVYIMLLNYCKLYFLPEGFVTTHGIQQPLEFYDMIMENSLMCTCYFYLDVSVRPCRFSKHGYRACPAVFYLNTYRTLMCCVTNFFKYSTWQNHIFFGNLTEPIKENMCFLKAVH